MALWATKRRFIYGGGTIIISALIVGALGYKLFYRAPTCFDGIKDGGETGIDCGGGCQRLCTSDALDPIVLWQKIFNISGDVYSAVALAENPNNNSENPRVTYRFDIYDANNRVITSVEGETSIPKGKKFMILEPGIVLKNQKPKFVEFKLLTYGPWQKNTTSDPDVRVTNSSLQSTSTSPHITGTITNNSLQNIHQVELDAIVLDGNDNAVAASRTFVDNLLKRTSQDFVFTWPKPFNLGVEVCAKPLDVVVDLDRSGSMRSESKSPPEPFSTVINTAETFVYKLNDTDEAAVISFGNDARVESPLSQNKNAAISAISNMSLATTSESTNIMDGLAQSLNELNKSSNPDNKKAIVLLTDGLPTVPVQTGLPDYPRTSAQDVAKNILTQGIGIYTIGLGKDVSDTFLKSISTDAGHYFFAPNKESLSAIYAQINSSLCELRPSVITVLYRFL